MPPTLQEKDHFVIENFCGYYVEGYMGAIPAVAEPELDNLFGNYTISMDRSSYGGLIPIGKAKETVLKHSLRQLTFEGRQRTLNREKITASLPDWRDDETGDSLFERLVKICVKRNRWLVKRSYGNLFEVYLEDERVIDAETGEDVGEDPTMEELPPPSNRGKGSTSSSESSSTSPSGRDPIPTITPRTGSGSTDGKRESSSETTNSQTSSDSEESTDLAASQS